MRVLTILQRYSQLSEAYISNELRVLWPNYEMSILALGVGNVPQRRHFPYQLAGSTNSARLIDLAQAAHSLMIHAHYLHLAPLVHRVAESLKVPYTIRTQPRQITHHAPACQSQPAQCPCFRDIRPGQAQVLRYSM